MKVVIVGGVAGGATAAARIRRLDENAEIVVFERSGFISYANCGLPYYIGGVITEKKDLTLQTPKSFWNRFKVDMRVRHEVSAIDSENKKVTVKNLETGEVFEESYDKLILSPGARPTQPEIPGVDTDKVFAVRTVEDTYRVRDYVVENEVKTAIIAGGGFIGLEMAENLTEMGIKVTIIQRPKHLMNTLDEDMASFVHSKMRKKGVSLKLGKEVLGFEKYGDGVKVLVKDENALAADMVILAIGVTPDTYLAKEAGLELGLKGSIVVNEKMETSVKDIYAVGDAVEVKHFITGKKVLIPLAGPANKQGRIVAKNICGGNAVFTGSQGSAVLKVFDLTVASTGITEKTAKDLGLDYEKVFLSPASHATYYPGGKLMNIKVLFENGTNKLLGAQIVGNDGVDKRIDVFATAMHAGLTAIDLTELDLAYAPPFSSAKDPVNMAGFMIENIAEGRIKQFHWHDIDTLPRDGSVYLLDTRTPKEVEKGSCEGFVNIPVDKLREHIDELPKDKTIYVMCQSGLRSYISCCMLANLGFDCLNLAGGYRLYESVMLDKAAAETAMPCGMEI